jgi:pimeloyl-ACP methyl ester carboxylesterase
MGGMIVQMMAIEHPDRVLSMTSIMSTTGAADVDQPDPAAMTALLMPPPDDRAGAIDATVITSRVIACALFDEREAHHVRPRRTIAASIRPVPRDRLSLVRRGARAGGRAVARR